LYVCFHSDKGLDHNTQNSMKSVGGSCLSLSTFPHCW